MVQFPAVFMNHGGGPIFSAWPAAESGEAHEGRG